MQFPESWLREFCNPPITTQQLADALTMAGLEVEELRPVAPPFSQVVVGAIQSVTQHPNADRLRVCMVDVGQSAPLQIVCGASNARSGIRVPCALVGAELPPEEGGKPLVIKLGKLRGVESEGMLCSARELRLSDDHDGLLELTKDAIPGCDIRQHLKLDDTLFTLKLTPNLAHCLSVYGIAREVSALTGSPLIAPSFPPTPVRLADQLPVRVSAPDLCGRFSGRIVRGVNTKAPTPSWMLERLERCGQRSVNALVDISNYVMFEFGRPSHIFDLDKLHGGLNVRWGHPGETLKLLNGNVVTVDESVGVIADDCQIESLAGIMGGDATAVSDDTRHVYVEAAFWWPSAITGRSRRFNFSTDAGHRFERGVDPGNTVEHIERITGLILEICGGEAGPIDDHQPNMPQPEPVSLRVARAARVIGMPLTQLQCASALRSLYLDVFEGDGVLTVTPPSYRFDLRIEEDLIEEVARMVGYENLPTVPPQAPVVPKSSMETRRSPYGVRRTLATLGYQETINFSFVEERWERDLAGNPDPIRLLNPIASQMSVMRSSLLGSLLQALKFNTDRKVDRVRLFEIGRVFLRDGTVTNSDVSVEGFHQPMRIAGLVFGAKEELQWGCRDVGADFFDVKGDVETLLSPRQVTFEAAQNPALHPGRCARVIVEGVVIGSLGELHPRWKQAWNLARSPVMFELDMNAVLQREVPSALPVPKFQTVERDLAVVVAERVTHADVMAAVWSASTDGVLRDAVLFDIYRSVNPTHSIQALAVNKSSSTSMGLLEPGSKSLAIRLTLNSDEGTLNEQQIDVTVDKVINRLAQAVGARLRT